MPEALRYIYQTFIRPNNAMMTGSNKEHPDIELKFFITMRHIRLTLNLIISE